MTENSNAFDKLAEEYDRWFDTPQGNALFESEIEAVRLLTDGLERPFLEIGVGSGRFARALGIEFGIDPSPRLLQLALKGGIKVRKAQGESLPFNAGSFGAVFILFTLCFVKDPAEVIAEARRVLRQRGHLIIGIINKESPWGRFYMQKRDGGHTIYSLARFYDADEVSEMLTAADFTVESYSSTLCQLPSVKPSKEVAHTGLIREAGFICIRANKSYQETGHDHY
jgi:SAM-dependent methyltransferase